MKVILFYILLFLLIFLLKNCREKFANYNILVNEPIDNFHYRFRDYLNGFDPKDRYLYVLDKYGYVHHIDPKVINPQFIFDEGLRYGIPWHNPNQKVIQL